MTAMPDQAARTVRLLHRRRGWAWTAGGSLACAVAYTIAGAAFFQDFTGTPELLTVVVLVALLALGLAALIAVVVDTVRLQRAGPAARSAALAQTSHHPLLAHAYRYPPRHRSSWFSAWVMLALWLLLAIVLLPALVNSTAYLTGLSPRATFVPVSYEQKCYRGNCKTVTEGYLKGSGTQVAWDGQVPLSRPFPVRAPVWAWGMGHTIIENTGSAINQLGMSLISGCVGYAVLLSGVRLGRHLVLHRQQAAHADA